MFLLLTASGQGEATANEEIGHDMTAREERAQEVAANGGRGIQEVTANGERDI